VCTIHFFQYLTVRQFFGLHSEEFLKVAIQIHSRSLMEEIRAWESVSPGDDCGDDGTLGDTAASA